ncbi:MAG TPA: hypothetical protein VNW04_19555 [Puia sp.]|nr:hypothetical protein [Puia sp.]
MTITLHTYFLLSCSPLFAQQVSYCEPYSDRFTLRQEMLGKVGEYYWVSAVNRKKAVHRANEFTSTEERDFVIYDNKGGVKNMIDEPLYTLSSVREYLVAADEHFDRIDLLRSGRETEVRLQRYESGGEALEPDHTIGIFPFTESGTSFMMVRSLDRKRCLLLGFEFVSSGAPRLHAFLYDQDWRLLSKRVYRHPFLSQPIIQDDYSTYPLEDFNKAPIKLADDGQWLMLSPSRTNSNFLLFHFAAVDSAVTCREVMLPGTSVMEDVCLSVDNATGDAVGGILSTFHYSPLKNVQVVHYSMRSKTFSFDSSYRLNTLGGRRIRNDNLVKENFVAVPGRGFLLMKEYGRAYEREVEEDVYDEGWDPAFLFASNDIPDPSAGPSPVRVRLPEPRYGYARYKETANPVYHDRGDLSLYYFPGSRKDSCWSGLITQEQVTELNSPNLSYMMVPMQDRIVLLYNSFVHGEKVYASTTVIDPRGEQVTNEGILFWGLKKTLDFQQSRQVAPDQVVIPYDIFVNGNANGKIGFAVVLFR